MYLGFVLIRYGKTHRCRNDCREGRILYSQIPKSMRHQLLGHAGQGSNRTDEEEERGGQSMAQRLHWGSV